MARQSKLRPVFAVPGIIVLGIFVVGWIYNWSRTGTLSGNGFSDDDVRRMEQGIRDELSKQSGVTVEDVQLIKESPKKLTGFAKVRMPPRGAITESCTATLGEDGHSISRCTER
jgi:hypothetical protein